MLISGELRVLCKPICTKKGGASHLPSLHTCFRRLLVSNSPQAVVGVLASPAIGFSSQITPLSACDLAKIIVFSLKKRNFKQVILYMLLFFLFSSFFLEQPGLMGINPKVFCFFPSQFLSTVQVEKSLNL